MGRTGVNAKAKDNNKSRVAPAIQEFESEREEERHGADGWRFEFNPKNRRGGRGLEGLVSERRSMHPSLAWVVRKREG